jgi:hypothetical protein
MLEEVKLIQSLLRISSTINLTELFRFSQKQKYQNHQILHQSIDLGSCLSFYFSYNLAEGAFVSFCDWWVKYANFSNNDFKKLNVLMDEEQVRKLLSTNIILGSLGINCSDLFGKFLFESDYNLLHKALYYQ